MKTTTEESLSKVVASESLKKIARSINAHKVILIPQARNVSDVDKKLPNDIFKKCKEYAEVMKTEEYTKPNCADGEKFRTEKEMFGDLLLGKCGEGAGSFELKKIGECGEPDYRCHGRGKYDSGDLIVGKELSNVKAVKHFSSLFLLERNYWRSSGWANLKDYSFHFFVKIRLEEWKNKFIGAWYDVVGWQYGDYVADIVKSEEHSGLYLHRDCLFKKENSSKEPTKMNATNYFLHEDDFLPLSTFSPEKFMKSVEIIEAE